MQLFYFLGFFIEFEQMSVFTSQKGGPQWFKLQDAETGEIQVQFKVSFPGEQVTA